MSLPGTFACDEYGRPFIVLRDQENQKRLTGNEAIKVRFSLRLLLPLSPMNHPVTTETSIVGNMLLYSHFPAFSTIQLNFPIIPSHCSPQASHLWSFSLHNSIFGTQPEYRTAHLTSLCLLLSFSFANLRTYAPAESHLGSEADCLDHPFVTRTEGPGQDDGQRGR